MQLKTTISLCNACHDQIHAIFSQKVLEHTYYDIKIIKSHPAMEAFIKWIRNKPIYIKPRVKCYNYYYEKNV